MAQKSCNYDWCAKGLLKKAADSLTRIERQHVQLYHKEASHTIVVNNALFNFSRNQDKDKYYICACGSQLVCSSSLRMHVQGSNTTVKRKACQKVIELAEDFGRGILKPEQDWAFTIGPIIPSEPDSRTVAGVIGQVTMTQESSEPEEPNEPVPMELEDSIDQEDPTNSLARPNIEQPGLIENRTDNDVDFLRILDRNEQALRMALEDISRMRQALQQRIIP
ncbi:hypothetical protein BGZ70_002208 [Mortierella alpina]|uniref:Uncharacterized protein n=1 Tax=Mortierella alpina TaxID=64518 RepID=A0A9P6IUM7_MORAP|nr:hypothetical protein BGZ70_002208 [Mortierella alpina]